MVGIVELWLPILLSAVFVFFASFVVHMIVRYHAGDWKQLPGEDKLRAAMREAGLQPGNYMMPYATSPSEMGKPEMIDKFKEGPVGFLLIRPSGAPAMGKQLAQWFVYSVVVGVLVAYVTGRTLGADAEYLQVFRVAGTVAFLTYAGAEPIASIWKGYTWSVTLKHLLDGFIYALLTAGSFAGFWPS
jgi:hypothetical protein